MKFTPDTSDLQTEVPFLDEARAEDGWQGQGTKESIASLRSQISAEIGRLGGTVTRWMRGDYEIDGQKRPGVQLEYQITNGSGSAFVGRIDLAGLPWKDPYGGNRSHSSYKVAVESNKNKSLAMALYNVREALKAMRILQVLSPGYAALVPWMLVAETGKTIGEMWGIGNKQLMAPSGSGEVVEAEFHIVSE